ncbi:Carbonic anhydrase [compost metagenome]
MDNAIARNVKNSVEKLKNATPVLTEAISQGKLNIVGGVYRLATGKVDLIA